MYVYVCFYLCISIFVSMCVYIYIYTCMDVQMHLCTNVDMHPTGKSVIVTLCMTIEFSVTLECRLYGKWQKIEILIKYITCWFLRDSCCAYFYCHCFFYMSLGLFNFYVYTLLGAAIWRGGFPECCFTNA